MIELRRQRTRYDESAESLTVATPSCCCCCCCCLATIAGITTFTGVDVDSLRKSHGGTAWATLVAILAVPIATAVSIALGNNGVPRDPALIALPIVAIGLYVLAYRLANVRSSLRAIGRMTLVLLVGGFAVFAEVIAVLFTVGLAWLLLIPLAIFVSLKAARAGLPATAHPRRPYGPMATSPEPPQAHDRRPSFGDPPGGPPTPGPPMPGPPMPGPPMQGPSQ